MNMKSDLKVNTVFQDQWYWQKNFLGVWNFTDFWLMFLQFQWNICSGRHTWLHVALLFIFNVTLLKIWITMQYWYRHLIYLFQCNFNAVLKPVAYTIGFWLLCDIISILHLICIFRAKSSQMQSISNHFPINIQSISNV